MVRMIDCPRKEDVDIPLTCGKTRHLRRHSEDLRKYRDRHTGETPHQAPLDMIENHELVEQLEPGSDGLDVKVEVARVADHRTPKRSNVRRNQMPFEHLSDEEIRPNAVRNQRADIRVRAVRNLSLIHISEPTRLLSTSY